MRAAIAFALLALAASASAQKPVYIASVVALGTPLPAGVAGKPEDGRKALTTIAELNQNSTLGATNFNWELVFVPEPGKPFPVKYELVAYTPGGNPANGAVILTLGNNPAGLEIDTSDVQGEFTLQQLNAGRVAAGLPDATACDPPAGCTPGPGAAIKFGDRMLYVLTFSDGGIIAGQAVDSLPDSFYPEQSDDGFYLADFNNVTSFAAGGAPALLTPVDSLFFDVYDNFDGSWGLDVLTTLGAKKLTSAKIVALVGGAPVTVLDLSRRVDFNSPLLDDTGFSLANAFTDAELVQGMKAAGLSQTTELLGAVTIADGATTYTNYAKFDPVWFRTPAAPSPPPPAKKPTKPTPKPSTCAKKANATIPSEFNLGKPAQAATTDACCSRCKAVAACKGWTLNTKNVCQLKTSGVTQYKASYSSGAK